MFSSIRLQKAFLGLPDVGCGLCQVPGPACPQGVFDLKWAAVSWLTEPGAGWAQRGSAEWELSGSRPLERRAVLVSSGCRTDATTEWLGQQPSPSSSPGGRRAEIRMPVWLGPGESPLLGWQRAVFLLCPPRVERKITSLKSFLTGRLIPSWGPTLMTSFKPNHLPKAPLLTTIPGRSGSGVCM